MYSAFRSNGSGVYMFEGSIPLACPARGGFSTCKMLQRYCMYLMFRHGHLVPRLLLILFLPGFAIPPFVNEQLPIGFQGRSRRLNEGCYLQYQRNGWWVGASLVAQW